MKVLRSKASDFGVGETIVEMTESEVIELLKSGDYLSYITSGSGKNTEGEYDLEIIDYDTYVE